MSVMKELTLTAHDQARLQILNHVVAGQCTAVEAAGLLELARYLYVVYDPLPDETRREFVSTSESA